MNIYDISEKAGVSIATVSRVLNGNSRVSEKTREKILRVIEETGYQPNVFARGLGKNTMSTIGILCADSSDLVLSSALYHVEQELQKYEYNALLCCTGYDYQAKAKYTGLLLYQKVDALIYVGSNFVEQEAEKNQYILDAAKEVPVMIVNGYLKAPNVYCTVCDDRNIVRRVTAPFLEKTDRVLFLSWFLSYSARQKILGFRDALEEKGAVWSEDRVLVCGDSVDGVCEALQERWAGGARWDVIMAANDELAIAARKFALRQGIHVPNELQIVGYNNSRVSHFCEPELTSIANHLDLASREAVRLLMRLLSGEKEQIPGKVTIPCELIVRGTTGDLSQDL